MVDALNQGKTAFLWLSLVGSALAHIAAFAGAAHMVESATSVPRDKSDALIISFQHEGSVQSHALTHLPSFDLQTKVDSGYRSSGVVRSAEQSPSSVVGLGRTQAAPAGGDTGGAESLSDYVPAASLDRPALPRSAPDFSTLDGLHPSGLPISVRVFIDQEGIVRDVRPLQSNLLDEDFLLSLRHVFLATVFIPGRLRGKDVRSFNDMEFSFSPLD